MRAIAVTYAYKKLQKPAMKRCFGASINFIGKLLVVREIKQIDKKATQEEL